MLKSYAFQHLTAKRMAALLLLAWKKIKKKDTKWSRMTAGSQPGSEPEETKGAVSQNQDLIKRDWKCPSAPGHKVLRGESHLCSPCLTVESRLKGTLQWFQKKVNPEGKMAKNRIKKKICILLIR